MGKGKISNTNLYTPIKRSFSTPMPVVVYNHFDEELGLLGGNDFKSSALELCKDNINMLDAYKYFSEHLPLYSMPMLPPQIRTELEHSLNSFSYEASYLHNWNLYKQIYRFDEDVFDLLTYDVELKNINPIIFKNLPFKSIFIDLDFEFELNITEEYKEKCFGFFVDIQKIDSNEYLVVAPVVETQIISPYVVPIVNEEILLDDICSKSVKYLNLLENTFIGQAKYYGNRFLEYLKSSNFKSLFELTFPLITYLCADNRDVEIRQGKTPKETYSINKQSKKYGVVQQNVGFKFGSTIRQKKIYYEQHPEAISKKGSHKSPHIRRGHYHSFWTGKKDGSEERKIILKFIEPIFIGQGEISVPIVHKIDGKN